MLLAWPELINTSNRTTGSAAETQTKDVSQFRGRINSAADGFVSVDLEVPISASYLSDVGHSLLPGLINRDFLTHNCVSAHMLHNHVSSNTQGGVVHLALYK